MPEPSSSPDALDADVVLEHLQEFAHVGFIDLDLATDELYLSTQVFQILGMETASLEAYLDAVHPDDLEVVHQVAERVRAQPGPYRLRHRSRDGSRLLQVRVQSVPDATGRPVRVIGVISDVTAEWQLERALETSASARLTGLLAGGAVHDLKNIFVVLLGHSQLAMAAHDRGDLPDRESLAALHRAAQHGIELTQQLLQVGRSEPVPGRRTDVEQLFRRLGATARTALGRRRDIVVDPGPGGLDLLVDEARLERAVVDLLLNARDALPTGGGTVWLRFCAMELDGRGVGPFAAELPPGTYGAVEVSDDGSGMPPEVLARVTDPFFTTKGAEGSGVGLHAVARFVEAAGGALHIESTPGLGTRVRLVLPAERRDDEPAERPSARRATPVRVVVHGADGERVGALAGALRAEGLQCVATTSGAAAAAALRTEPIDLLVVDDTTVADAALLRAAASTTTPVLGTLDVAGDPRPDPFDEDWTAALVAAATELVGRERAQLGSR